jgi:hypothetical protein
MPLLSAAAPRRRRLEKLGIVNLASSIQKPGHASGGNSSTKSKKRARTGDADVPRRQSLRAKGEAPSQEEMNVEEAEPKPAARVAEVEGARHADGKWRGERFGEVDDVAVGTVFGAGDYQRQGRFDMSARGFFVPLVQPEWLEPGKGCSLYLFLLSILVSALS